MNGGIMFHYFVDLSNNSFVFKEQVSDEKYNIISSHIERISALKCDDARFKIIEHSYNDFIVTINRIIAGEKALATNGTLTSKLTGFLSCVRKYLDNWETYIKTIYGKQSIEAQIFSTETSFIYDNNPEYCFMYRLRNYDQHCEIVFSSFTESANPDGTISRVVLVNKAKLLNSPFKGWKQVDLDFISTLDDSFDILPIIKKYYDCLKQLHSQLLRIHFNKELFNSCSAILEEANRFENENGIEILSSENELSEIMAAQDSKTFHSTHLFNPECKVLLSQLLKENSQAFRIFVEGAELCARLQGIDCEESSEKMELFTSPTCHSTIIDGAPYIRIKCHILFEKGALVIFAHAGLYTKENKKMLDEFCKYIETLSKV